MADDFSLPPGFEPLEPFAEFWAVAEGAERARRRGASTPENRAAFYAAATELLAPALAHLDRKALSDLDGREQRLLNLMLSLAHVSLAVELQGEAEPVHAEARRLMPITRTSAGPAGPP